MTLPYEEIFLVLLAAYSLYSIYARLDGRYPIAGALILLVAAAGLDAAGSVSAANTVAVFVFFLLAAGVLLLLIEHVREERAARTPARSDAREPQASPDTELPGGDAADRAGSPPDHPSDRPEDQPIAPVDDGGERDHEEEEAGDAHDDEEAVPRSIGSVPAVRELDPYRGERTAGPIGRSDGS